MELTKVKNVNEYIGRLYFIFPYVCNGKVARLTVRTYVQTEKVTEPTIFNEFYCVPTRAAGVAWDNPSRAYFRGIIQEDSVVDKHIRFFTTKEEAENALNEFKKQNVYKINDSIDKELKFLETEKKKIQDKIDDLKKRKKECFKLLTTTFSSKY
jgi:hypothetical protein